MGNDEVAEIDRFVDVEQDTIYGFRGGGVCAAHGKENAWTY